MEPCLVRCPEKGPWGAEQAEAQTRVSILMNILKK